MGNLIKNQTTRTYDKARKMCIMFGIYCKDVWTGLPWVKKSCQYEAILQTSVDIALIPVKEYDAT